VKFHVWDTAGQEKFRDLVPLYFRSAVAALVVFEVTSRRSFENVPEWIETLKGVSPDCLVAIVGNKCDIQDQRVVTPEDGEALARSSNVKFYTETSALSGEGIDALFPRVLELIVSRSEPLAEPVPVDLNGRSDNGDCC
jgi:small GTP-binding protein